MQQITSANQTALVVGHSNTIPELASLLCHCETEIMDESEFNRLFPRLDAIRYRRFVAMLSSLSGTVVNKAQLGRSVDVLEVTIRDYLDIADKTFFLANDTFL